MNATKTILTRAFNKAGMWFLIIVAASVWASGQQEVKQFDKPAPEGSYEQVMTEFTCKDTVKGKFPTAVVLQEVSGGVVVSVNPVHIGKALDEQFAGKEWKRFTPIHFCK